MKVRVGLISSGEIYFIDAGSIGNAKKQSRILGTTFQVEGQIMRQAFQHFGFD